MDPYATHLPLLVATLQQTFGPILEVGTGAYSSPILKAYCQVNRRPLVQTDFNSKRQIDGVLPETDPSGVLDLHKHWSIVFVDSGIAESRANWIRLAAPKATLIVFHDADDCYDHLYKYSTVRGLFEHRYRYDLLHPATEVVSNLVPLDWLRDRIR